MAAQILGLAQTRAQAAAIVAASVVVLGGCSSSGSGLSDVMSGLTSQTSTAASQPPAPSKLHRPVLVALVPIVGGPDGFQQQVVKQLNQSASTRNVALVVDSTVPCDYTLRGYVMTQRETTGLKMLYVWDLLDKTGNRLQRLTGETPPAAVPAAGDDWAAISAIATNEMAEKAVATIVTSEEARPGANKI